MPPPPDGFTLVEDQAPSGASSSSGKLPSGFTLTNDKLDPEKLNKIKSATQATTHQRGQLPNGFSLVSDTKQDPLISTRVKIYKEAIKNGFTPQIAGKTAVAEAVGMTADPSNWQKIKSSVDSIPTGTGETLGDAGRRISNVWDRLSNHLNNPVGMSDEEWEKKQKQFDDFIDKYRDKTTAGEIAGGAVKGIGKFAAEMTSPVQAAMMVGTFGESALVRAAATLGVDTAVPIARTVAKLIQTNFAAQMVEGTVSGVNQAIDAARKGNWEEASEAAIGGLISGVMAKGLMGHEEATVKVQSDLNKTAQEQHGKSFDSLDPYTQGKVIHETVQNSEEYKQQLDTQDVKNAREIRKRKQRYEDYHDRAIKEAWEPDTAKRAIKDLIANKANEEQEAHRLHYVRQVVDRLKQATEAKQAEADENKKIEDEVRSEGRSERPDRKASENAERESQKAIQLANADQIANARSAAAKTRDQADEQISSKKDKQRPVDASVGEDGHVSYQANYFGESNSFGVAGDQDHLGVYRQTPRGIQYLTDFGVYADEPDPGRVYIAPDYETADTLARLSSLRHEAESTGNAKEESLLAEHERAIVAGEKTAAEVRKEAGLNDKIELPSEVDALRSGNLNGPMAEKSSNEFYSALMDEAQSNGFSPEETEALMNEAGVVARSETENNLHHVGRSGDYITSKKGVRWTLDSRGMLHPDDGGNPFPLMKNGRYSSQAIDLAMSGKVGYGTSTREQRRLDNARRRNIQEAIGNLNVELNAALDHVLKVAQQNVGLEQTPENLPSEVQPEKQERAKKFERPPDPATAQARQVAINVAALIRDGLEKSGAAEVVDSIAKANGVDALDVIREKLSQDDSPRGKIASLQPGDQISDKFRPDRPWVVEQSPNGGLHIRSGKANPLPLDRLNPSARILKLVEEGSVKQERPITDQDVEHAAFEAPHVAYRDALVEQVQQIANGKQTIPEPNTKAQAEAQEAAAERRTEAAIEKATETQAEALEPPPGATEVEVNNKVEESIQDAKTAETAYAQEAEIKSKSTPPDAFPPRASISIGLRGNAGFIKQNGREFQMHYEMVPLDSLVTSHRWEGNRQVVNPDYEESLQPRTISEAESKQNAMRAQERQTDDRGMSTGYDFSEYADKTINGQMGPAIVEGGGRVVGGNTRIGIMRKHLENLRAIDDPDRREVALAMFRDEMNRLARENGIVPPDSDAPHVVIRVLDEPIQTLREAAELGRLFNKSVSVQMTQSAKGVSYSKSLSDANISTVGRLIEDHDGLAAAIQANPEYFSQLVTEKFGIVPSEYADWFEPNTDRGLVLNEQGRNQFIKSLLGTVFKNNSVLNAIEGKQPYRALERALPYLVKMKAIADRDLTQKVVEAATASAQTIDTDPSLANSRDKWAATYKPDQQEFMGMETPTPPEPDRLTEALWRAMNAGPRTLNDRLKNWIGEESAANVSMFAVHETPAEVFSRVFAKELKEVAFSRGDKGSPSISQNEFDSLLRNQELSDQAREEAKRAEDGKAPKQPKTVEEKKTAKMEKPPEPPKPITPDTKIAEAKAEKGFVTPGELKTFLESHPSTKENASTIMRTAQMMAEYVFEADPPEGLDKKDALAWILKERVAKLEFSEKGRGRGSYSDPLVEKGIGTSILKLTKAADETTFIHEFAHVIFPMLSESDIRDLNTIHDSKIPQWDHDTPLKGDAYNGLSEKFARGLEKFLRDENPTGFTGEVKKLLGKVKEMFRKAYLRFAGDPLNTFELSEEAKEVFAKMFGITDMDVADRWRDEVKKAKAKESGMKRPDEMLHPLASMAKYFGATGLKNRFAGKVEETTGDRVDPRKPMAVLTFPDAAAANTAWIDVGTEGSKIQDAELLSAEDGTYGIRFNTQSKVPNDLLFQEIPRKHPGIELEETKKKLASTPESAPMVRKLLQLKVQNLENEIRAKYGAEERKPESVKEAAKQAVGEKRLKNVSEKLADRRAVIKESNEKRAITNLDQAKEFLENKNGERTVPVQGLPRLPEGTAGDLFGRRIGQVPKRGIVGLPDNANSKRDGGPLPGTRTLTGVKPVNLEPQSGRGDAVGLLEGEKFNATEWLDGLKKAGLPENAPPPTVPISKETAAMLKYAGQKQTVQLVLSGLQQGDGFVVANSTGTGKTVISGAIIKEFINANPGAKVLYITKNRGLLDGGTKSFKQTAKGFFGLTSDTSGKGFDVSRGTPEPGVYGATYQRLLANKGYALTDWDLVIADESGEMRNWFRTENQQGKAAIDVIRKSKKAVYVSATPFHSPSEYGYAEKLNLWPKNQFDKWISDNFAHEKLGDKIVAKLDPAKQAKLRQQLIERGQFVSQQVSYEGFTTHFGIVPITDETRRALNRIHEGVARAKSTLLASGKKGLATRLAAFEATYTKAFLERSRLPQAIELGKKAQEAGWHPIFFSETTSEDLFRRDEDGQPSTYQKLDQEMGGELSRIIPPFPDVFEELSKAFGTDIGDYSGGGNSDFQREESKRRFNSGELPALYTTYAAGGIGVSLHDEVGNAPRLSIFLGPPYSGVLLEQAMGRTWRFGVKSNARAVFLATDSEPDIRLMATKVGPRMKALRASVLGERDALGTVMGNYSEDEKLRERQDVLAYDQGNEVKVDAQSFQKRMTRNVNIDNWSAINFPDAASAHNKGMQIKVAGANGNWATMYQPKGRMVRPQTLAERVAERKLNKVAESIAEGTGLHPDDPMNEVEPAERETIAEAAAAVGAEQAQINVEGRDAGAAAKMAAENMYKPGWKQDENGVWQPPPGSTIDREKEPEQPIKGPEKKVKYGLFNSMVWSGEHAIRSICRQAGVPELGEKLVRMQRDFIQTRDNYHAQYVNEIMDVVERNKLDAEDPKTFRNIIDVVERKAVSKNPVTNKAAEEIADLHEIIHGDAAINDVKVRNREGKDKSYRDFSSDRTFIPHVADWDAKIQDPETGEVATLKEIMGETFDEKKRRRMVQAMAAEKGVSPEQIIDDLNRRKKKPWVLGNVQRTREADFPIYKKDLKTLLDYYDQMAQAIARQKVFGGEDLTKLAAEVAKIPNDNARKTILSLFDQNFNRQGTDTPFAKWYNRIAAFQILSKMNFSVLKVPFHLANVPLGLGGDPRAFIKAGIGSLINRREFKENATMAGTTINQINPMELMGANPERSIAAWALRKEGFEATYRWARAIAGSSAKVWMEQYGMNALKKSGKSAETAKRILRDRMTISDAAIDKAIETGEWTRDDLNTAQRSFANFSMFSEHNPLQMPPASRLNMDEMVEGNFHRAIRMTYLLQSFAVKYHSFARETIVDEIKRGNVKPLIYLIAAQPILGVMLKGVSTAGPSAFRRLGEQVTGKKHDKDSFDNFLDQLKALYGDHPAIAALKLGVDGIAAASAFELLKTIADPLLTWASNEPGSYKKGRTQMAYEGLDTLEQFIGPGWSSVLLHPAELLVNETLDATLKKPEDRLSAEERSLFRWLFGEFPSGRLIPGAESLEKKEPKKTMHKAPIF